MYSQERHVRSHAEHRFAAGESAARAATAPTERFWPRPTGFGGHAMRIQHHIAAIKEHTIHKLTALREPAHNFAGGIQFTMMDGPTRIICWVSREALARINRIDPCQQDPIACFERHRRRIEQLASKK
jgi:hypothetical protein